MPTSGAINRSYDATFNVDLYAGAPSGAGQAFSQRSFWGLGTEFRYRPSEGTAGDFTGYMIDDTERDEKRWRMRWNHQSDQLPGGFRGVVNFQDVSDFDFFRDFERRVDRYSLRHLYSNAFITRNWGKPIAQSEARPAQDFRFRRPDQSNCANSPKSSTSCERRVWGGHRSTSS